MKESIITFARIVLGGIFIYASIDKIAFPGEFTKAVQAYSIIPEFLINPVVIILPWIELIAGIFLVAGILLKQTALFISFLIIIFFINTTIGFITGTLQECGCFSKSQILYTNNKTLTVFRDLLLFMMSVLLYLSSKTKTCWSKRRA